MPTTVKPTVRVMALDAIRPYWRNPRTIPDDATRKVADSIERFGYQAPIIVDSDGVIITGHTRYKALRLLEVEKVAVIVADLPADKAREYRVIDNRTSEYTSWAPESLILELREFDAALLADWFPKIDLTTPFSADSLDVTGAATAAAADAVGAQRVPGQAYVTAVTCPHCYAEFDLDLSRVTP